ncbi:MAG: glycosyltransferase family 4 protein [Deltaproteobacteria bacterium]|nr:glycosyltransferase family 4 protein [Deltaproteobacteria bacterium]
MGKKILFITRNYPPRVGGLETYSYDLIREFQGHESVHKITLSGSRKHLVWFLPYALFRGIYLVRRRSIGYVHLCDGFLAPVGLLIGVMTGAQVSVTLHGLDLTYQNRLYQVLVPWCIARLDKVVCVSRSTLGECLRRINPCPEHRVIPNGIRPGKLYLRHPRNDLRRTLEGLTGISLGNREVLFTVGRLIKRKGVNWFVEEVMPRLGGSFLYLIAGNGPEKGHIQEVIRRRHLEDRVLLLGEIPLRIRNLLYNAADIFIMSNITIDGDAEGFGIVALEAGTCGLPVVASNIQGIRDAVIHGKTGYLVGERDVEGFVQRIENMNLEKERIREVVDSTFDWAKIYKDYRSFLLT